MLRYLLISDLHSNLEATLAVLERARALRFDRVVVLGDLVGYGPSPNEVVQIVRDLHPVAAIRGNHDKVVAGIEEGEDFNELALEAALHNRRELSPKNRDYLITLARGPRWVDEIFAIAHGTPTDEDEYLLSGEDAARVFSRTDYPLCFFGHTHVAGVFAMRGGEVFEEWPPRQGSESILGVGGRFLVNPGSVGQPRDRDPKASFALYDPREQELSIQRVPYSIRRTQERILEAGLPPVLASRLEHGV